MRSADKRMAWPRDSPYPHCSQLLLAVEGFIGFIYLSRLYVKFVDVSFAAIRSVQNNIFSILRRITVGLLNGYIIRSRSEWLNLDFTEQTDHFQPVEVILIGRGAMKIYRWARPPFC